MKHENRNNYSSYLIFNNFLKNFLFNNRVGFYKIFSKNIAIKKKFKILDVGSVNSDNKFNNVFLFYYPHKNRITCISNQKLNKLEKFFKKSKLIVGDCRKMIFKNNSYDVVHSNATIEHVGNRKNQIKFISECYRVSKKFVFIQTPNRFFPVEMHTFIPFIHFLPKKIFRYIIRFFGHKYLSLEKNLNLLTERDLRDYCYKLDIKNFKIKRYKLFGLTSNLILIIKKN